MAIVASAARSAGLTLVGGASVATQAAPTPAPNGSAVGAPSGRGRPEFAVRIFADDPVSLLGLRAQFEQAGVPVDDAGVAAAVRVLVMIFERFDVEAERQLGDLIGDPGAPVLVILTELDADAALAAMTHGATGVLRRRDVSPERLRAAVHGAGAGEVTFPLDLFSRMSSQFGRDPDTTSSPSNARRDRISDRERDVLRLVAEGHSTREVAAQLCYSERTIKNVLQELSVRLDLRNRTHVVSHAIRRGWI